MSGAHVALLTPRGRGAIAVLRVAGPAAGEVLARVVRAGPRDIEQLAEGRIAVGRLGRPDGEEIVVARLGRTEWELGCHGGTAAVEAALALLDAAGAQRCEGPNPLLPQALDSVAAEAWEDLPRAMTRRTAGILLDQFQGALRRTLAIIRERIAASQLDDAQQSIAELMHFAPLGQRLTRPWRVALVGQPNVGKSSLLNALAGYERAITHHEPGTTRDVVALQTAMEGWPLELLDTAGQRVVGDPLEAAGASLGLNTAAAADCVVLLSDLTLPWSAAEQALFRQFPTAVLVHNKADLLGEANADRRPAGLAISALTGAGLSALAAALLGRLVPLAPDAGAGVPFRPRHIDCLQTARVALAARDVTTAARALDGVLGSLDL